ncbi:MAG: glutamate--tRNA ligase [Saprospiraceae bacterium]|nr:glutamate--tRNA ligase [Saprospiraceae bacterium]
MTADSPANDATGRKVRVRFAPSPTGPLHIGGVRTALYNYLFAKKHGGDFLLRIEDTDQARYVPGAEEYIMQSLEWCGLIPDEGPKQGGPFGPYRQSERKELYQRQVQSLIDQGWAYYAFDTIEELESMRQVGDGHAKYDGSTRMSMRNSLVLSKDQTEQLISDGVPYVVRIKVPEQRQINFVDRIRGQVSFDSKELDDKVILKADGLPTYHLANVVDDHQMKITHVIRGEEWLSSTAHHVLLYEAFGWLDTMPEFSHLPLILKPTGKGKLSKRDGQKFGFPVFPLAWIDDNPEESFEGFKSVGFHPAALVNFLAFLGWNPGTEQEVFNLEQLIAAFTLDNIGKSGARFDYDKALWYNTQYIATMSPDELLEAVKPFLLQEGLDPEDPKLQAVCLLMQDRIKTFAEFPESSRYFFTGVKAYDVSLVRKKWNESTKNLMQDLVHHLQEVEQFEAEVVREVASEIINRRGVKFGDILPLLRVALSGEARGADIFSIMEILTKQETLERLSGAMLSFTQIVEMPE